jgi:hypothetical protein
VPVARARFIGMRASLAIALVGVIGTLLISAIAGSAGASTGCVNLAITPDVKPALHLAYKTAHGTRRTITGPLPGTTFYGRCGSTHWAIADFEENHRPQSDQPETFRRLAGHVWHDRGDDGSICSVPAGLRRLWGPRGEPCT